MPENYVTTGEFSELKEEFKEFRIKLNDLSVKFDNFSSGSEKFQAFSKKAFEQQTNDFQRYTKSLAEEFRADVKQMMEGFGLRQTRHNKELKELQDYKETSNQRILKLELRKS